MQPPIDPIVAEIVELLDEDLREAFEERAAIITLSRGKSARIGRYSVAEAVSATRVTLIDSVGFPAFG
jgi:hypothetical protein